MLARMAIMAALQARGRKGPAMSCCGFLLLFITVTTVYEPTTVMAKDEPPSTLTFYIIANRVPPNTSSITSASPSAAMGGPSDAFGTIDTVQNELRATAGDSPLLGYSVGQITVARDLSTYLSFAYKLSSPGLVGTITIQGTTDFFGNGELVITGGSGLFRWARGYNKLSFISAADPTHVVFKSVLYLKYD